jgi:cytosine/adenosine deaminase-related metal-dependent hydrolase
MAAAFGLPEDEALKAVTLHPAQILGVGDRLGSLEVGKRANIVVTSGHILQPTTPVLLLFIDGEPVAPTSRHTELYEKYGRRLDDVKAGRSPLGLDRPAQPPSGGAAGDS